MYFAQGQAELSTESAAFVDALATSLREQPADLAVVAAVGHAAVGEPESSDLAARRARSISNALIKLGIAPDRVPAYSFGSLCPVAPDADKNRVVELRVLRTARGDADVELGCDAARQVPKAGPKVRAGKAKPLDTSDWSQAAPDARLELVWTIDQRNAKPAIRTDPHDDLTAHDVPLELVLGVGGHSHTVPLHTNGAPPYVGSCDQLSFFFAGRNVRFALKRLGDGRVLLDNLVSNEYRSEVVTPLFVFAAPASAPIEARVVTIAPNGTRTTEICRGPQ